MGFVAVAQQHLFALGLACLCPTAGSNHDSWWALLLLAQQLALGLACWRPTASNNKDSPGALLLIAPQLSWVCCCYQTARQQGFSWGSGAVCPLSWMCLRLCCCCQTARGQIVSSGSFAGCPPAGICLGPCYCCPTAGTSWANCCRPTAESSHWAVLLVHTSRALHWAVCCCPAEVVILGYVLLPNSKEFTLG